MQMYVYSQVMKSRPKRPGKKVSSAALKVVEVPIVKINPTLDKPTPTTKVSTILDSQISLKAAAFSKSPLLPSPKESAILESKSKLKAAAVDSPNPHEKPVIIDHKSNLKTVTVAKSLPSPAPIESIILDAKIKLKSIKPVELTTPVELKKSPSLVSLKIAQFEAAASEEKGGSREILTVDVGKKSASRESLKKASSRESLSGVDKKTGLSKTSLTGESGKSSRTSLKEEDGNLDKRSSSSKTSLKDTTEKKKTGSSINSLIEEKGNIGKRSGSSKSSLNDVVGTAQKSSIKSSAALQAEGVQIKSTPKISLKDVSKTSRAGLVVMEPESTSPRKPITGPNNRKRGHGYSTPKPSPTAGSPPPLKCSTNHLTVKDEQPKDEKKVASILNVHISDSSLHREDVLDFEVILNSKERMGKVEDEKEVREYIRESYSNIQKFVAGAYPDDYEKMDVVPTDKKDVALDVEAVKKDVEDSGDPAVKFEEEAQEVDSIEKSYQSLQRYTQIIKGTREAVCDYLVNIFRNR
jgi:hypothetical protein